MANKKAKAAREKIPAAWRRSGSGDYLLHNQFSKLERRIECFDQTARARIDQDIRTHFIHRVAKSDFGVGIGEAK
jgi:hypothetical protein